MAANTLAPFGLVFSRSKIANAPTIQANHYKIKNGYGTNIGVGDIVSTGTGGNQGYVTLSAANPTTILGVFGGILGYFDTTLQQFFHGTFGAYKSTMTPPAGVDIDCVVYSSPWDVFKVQASGGPWTVSMRGNNVNWLSGTNGVPNAAGISTLAVDLTTVATTSSLPFRIEELIGVSGGPQDPANTNPLIEVSINFAINEMTQGTGI